MNFSQYSSILGDPLFDSIDISDIAQPVYIAGARVKSASTVNKYFSKRAKSLPKKSLSIHSISDRYTGGDLECLDEPEGICPSFAELDSEKIGAQERMLEEFTDLYNEDSDLSEELEYIGRGEDEVAAAGMLGQLDLEETELHGNGVLGALDDEPAGLLEDLESAEPDNIEWNTTKNK